MTDLINQLMLQVDNEVATQRTTKQLDYLVLDGSGSMSGKWYETLEALDKYAQGLNALGIESDIVMATFSGASFTGGEGDIEYNIVRNTTSDKWRSLREEPPLLPGGGTPLFDAINVAVRDARERNPEKASLVFATDGEENGSRTTDAIQAKALLDWCKARGWQITFIGCDFNNSRLAKQLGMESASAIGAPTKRLSDITGELAKKRGYYHTHSTPMHFSDAEKQQFGGYLSDQSNGGKWLDCGTAPRISAALFRVRQFSK